MEIVRNVHRIPRVNGNCYLITEPELVLIDTGLPHHARRILAYLTEILRREPSDLRMIFLTHSHFDHTGNAEELRRRTHARIAAHVVEADVIEGVVPPPRPKSLLIRTFAPLVRVRPFPVDVKLSDGQAIAGCTVLHTPGHTPGSICILHPSSGALFCGDVLRTPHGTIQGPKETFSADYRQACDSVRRIAELEFEALLSGHGKPVHPNASALVQATVSQTFGREDECIGGE